MTNAISILINQIQSTQMLSSSILWVNNAIMNNICEDEQHRLTSLFTGSCYFQTSRHIWPEISGLSLQENPHIPEQFGTAKSRLIEYALAFLVRILPLNFCWFKWVRLTTQWPWKGYMIVYLLSMLP